MAVKREDQLARNQSIDALRKGRFQVLHNHLKMREYKQPRKYQSLQAFE